MTPKRIQTRGARAMPAALWEPLASAPHRLLMLDCDGTLAPIRLYRSRVRVPEGTLKLLRALGWSRRTSLAVVSGRPLGELEALVPAVPAHLIAEHGWIERSSERRLLRWPLRAATAKGLEAAARAARASGLGPYLERKRSSLAVHTRRLAARRAREVEEIASGLWNGRYERSGLRLERFGGGVELMAIARHKGTAVERLLSQSPRGTIPVYLGDDVPDERAFRTVNAAGFAIRIGKPDGPTAAQLFPNGRSEVQVFLREWMARIERPNGVSGARPMPARRPRGTDADSK